MRDTMFVLRPSSFVLSVFLAGCVATQRDVLEVQTQMDDLSEKIGSLQKDINSLQKNQADLSAKMDELGGSITALNENLKESREKMSGLGSKLDDMQAGLGQKVETLGATLKQETSEAREEAIRAGQEAAAKMMKESEARQAAAKPSSAQVYKEAYRQYVGKNYDMAGQGFSVYLERYPKGEMADKATYYLGESRLAKKDYEGAAAQFAALLENFPKSGLTAAGRLKYALSLSALKPGDPEARRYLESVVKDFPKSAEAKTARRHLEKFDGKSR